MSQVGTTTQPTRCTMETYKQLLATKSISDTGGADFKAFVNASEQVNRPMCGASTEVVAYLKSNFTSGADFENWIAQLGESGHRIIIFPTYYITKGGPCCYGPVAFTNLNGSSQIHLPCVGDHHANYTYYPVDSKDKAPKYVVDKGYLYCALGGDGICFKIPWDKDKYELEYLPLSNDTNGFNTLYNNIRNLNKNQGQVNNISPSQGGNITNPGSGGVSQYDVVFWWEDTEYHILADPQATTRELIDLIRGKIPVSTNDIVSFTYHGASNNGEQPTEDNPAIWKIFGKNGKPTIQVHVPTLGVNQSNSGNMNSPITETPPQTNNNTITLKCVNAMPTGMDNSALSFANFEIGGNYTINDLKGTVLDAPLKGGLRLGPDHNRKEGDYVVCLADKNGEPKAIVNDDTPLSTAFKDNQNFVIVPRFVEVTIKVDNSERKFSYPVFTGGGNNIKFNELSVGEVIKGKLEAENKTIQSNEPDWWNQKGWKVSANVGHGYAFKDDKVNILTQSSNIPGVNASVPTVNANLPGVNPNLPGVNANLPGVNANLPGVNANLPGVNANLPGVNANLPGVIPGKTANNNTTTEEWTLNYKINGIVHGCTTVSYNMKIQDFRLKFLKEHGHPNNCSLRITSQAKELVINPNTTGTIRDIGITQGTEYQIDVEVPQVANTLTANPNNNIFGNNNTVNLEGFGTNTNPLANTGNPLANTVITPLPQAVNSTATPRNFDPNLITLNKKYNGNIPDINIIVKKPTKTTYDLKYYRRTLKNKINNKAKQGVHRYFLPFPKYITTYNEKFQNKSMQQFAPVKKPIVTSIVKVPVSNNTIPVPKRPLMQIMRSATMKNIITQTPVVPSPQVVKVPVKPVARPPVVPVQVPVKVLVPKPVTAQVQTAQPPFVPKVVPVPVPVPMKTVIPRPAVVPVTAPKPALMPHIPPRRPSDKPKSKTLYILQEYENGEKRWTEQENQDINLPNDTSCQQFIKDGIKRQLDDIPYLTDKWYSKYQYVDEFGLAFTSEKPIYKDVNGNLVTLGHAIYEPPKY